jgi:hypothetical protein
MTVPDGHTPQVVRAGPFVGLLAEGYDDVDGRFSLRVGGMRTATMSSKIPWWLPDGYRDAGILVVTGRRLSGTRATFTQRFPEAGTSSGPTPLLRNVYPSNINPPKTGCWRLTFHAGTARGSLIMLARPRFRG